MVNVDIIGVVAWLVVMCVLGGLIFVTWEASYMVDGVNQMW